MGSSPVALVLLKHGANPNVADRRTGTTPLHDAARTGFLDTVRLLVQHRADPQARDNKNCRPIDLAIEKDHSDVVDFLRSLENPVWHYYFLLLALSGDCLKRGLERPWLHMSITHWLFYCKCFAIYLSVFCLGIIILFLTKSGLLIGIRSLVRPVALKISTILL